MTRFDFDLGEMIDWDVTEIKKGSFILFLTTNLWSLM